MDPLVREVIEITNTVVFMQAPCAILYWFSASKKSSQTEAWLLLALNQALARACKTWQFVHHLDPGFQYVNIIYSEKLKDKKIASSTGSIGDSYDTAPVEDASGSYKNELTHTQSWDDLLPVEIVMYERGTRRNEHRLHEALVRRTPSEAKTAYRDQQKHPPIIENKRSD